MLEKIFHFLIDVWMTYILAVLTIIGFSFIAVEPAWISLLVLVVIIRIAAIALPSIIRKLRKGVVGK